MRTDNEIYMPLSSNEPATGSHFSVLHLIGTLIFGLIVGLVAKLFVPGENPGGMIVTILLGMGGAVVGSYLGRALGLYAPGHPAGFIMAVIGAIILLAIYHVAVGGRSKEAQNQKIHAALHPSQYQASWPLQRTTGLGK